MATTTKVNYSLDELKNEVSRLVETRKINRQQRICILCEFIPPREWKCVECELELNNYLLRDRICDLLPKEEWLED